MTPPARVARDARAPPPSRGWACPRLRTLHYAARASCAIAAKAAAVAS